MDAMLRVATMKYSEIASQVGVHPITVMRRAKKLGQCKVRPTAPVVVPSGERLALDRAFSRFEASPSKRNHDALVVAQLALTHERDHGGSWQPSLASNTAQSTNFSLC
jgi:hypothetical protein